MTRTGRLAMMCLTAVLLPVTASAQTVAGSFDELAKILKAGDTVTVTESDGRQTKGTFSSMTNGFLTMGKGSTTRTFSQTSVTSVVRRDSGLEGLLIGAGSGAVAGAIFVNSTCGGDPECTAIAAPLEYLTMIPAGAVAGFLIDKYTWGDRVYRAPGAKKSIAIMPAIGKHAGGLTVVLRF